MVSERQLAEFQKDPAGYRIDRIAKTTAGWDDAKSRTEVQRHKEEAADYRYFPDPDLVPVIVTAEQIEAVRAEMGELPQQQRARLVSQYGLSDYDSGVLTAKGRSTVAYFEAVAAAIGDAKAASNRMSDLIFPRGVAIVEFPLPAAAFGDFVKRTGPLSKQDRLDLLAHMLEHEVDLDSAMTATGIKPQTFDESTLRAAVVSAIATNPKAVADFKKGKDAAKMSIVGAVMKGNKGAPNEVVRRLVDEELNKV